MASSYLTFKFENPSKPELLFECRSQESIFGTLILKIEVIAVQFQYFKGIFQPFELGGVTRLIRSAVKFFKAGHLKNSFLMIQSHERSLKQISVA
jgi:hypothetical protein